MEKLNPKKKLTRGGRRRRTGLKRQKRAQAQASVIQTTQPIDPIWVDDSEQAVDEVIQQNFQTLLDDLPLRHFELPKLDPSLFEIITDRIKQKLPTIEAIKFNSTRKLLHEIDTNAAQLDNILASMTSLQSLDFKAQQDPLKNLQKLIAQLSSLIRYKKIPYFKSEHLELIAELKKELNFYYNHHEPLIRFISSLKTQKSPSWWYQLLRPFKNWIQFHQSLKKFKEIQDKIAYYEQLQHEQLFVVQETLFMIDKVIYGIENYQHIFGQISIGKMLDINIERVSFALIDTCPMQGLLKCYQAHFKDASIEGQTKLLYLIECLINNDKQCHLLDCDGKSQVMDQLIVQLERWVDDVPNENKDQLQNQLDIIKQNLSVLEANTLSNHKLFIEDLEHELYPIDKLVELLSSLSDDFNNHVRTLRHTVLFTHDIISHLPDNALSHPQHRKLITQLRHFIQQVSVSKNMALRQSLEELLDKNISNKIYELPEWAQSNTEVIPGLQPMDSREMSFNAKIEMIASGKLNNKQTKRFMINLCEMLRDHCKYLYQQISLGELKKASWTGQINQLQKQGNLHEKFPNLAELIRFETLMQNFVADIVLFELTPTKVARTNLKHIYRLLKFFDGARLYARKKDYVQVKMLIEKGLNHQAFDYFPEFKNNEIDTEYLVLECLKTTQLPPFSMLLDRLVQLHENCLGSFTYIVVGYLFSKLQKLKINLNNEEKPQLFIKECMVKRLSTKISEVHPSLTLEEINQPEQNQIYLDIAHSILTTSTEINDIKFPQIGKRCEKALAYQLPMYFLESFHETPKPLIKPLFLHLTKRVKQTEQIPTCRLILNIADNLSKNELIKPKTELMPSTAQLIKTWYIRVKHAIKTQSIDNEQLQTLIEELRIVQELMPEDLKSKKGSKEIVDVLDYIHTDSLELQSIQIGPAYSQAYIKTLESYLKGTQQSQVKLPTQWEQKGKETSKHKIVLQDIEEETHPDEIGFAETWNIFKQISNNLVQGPPFSYENLKDTFVKAFPWAIESEEDFGKQPLIDNMLHISPKIALDVQKTVMELVFISIDTIGKFAGPNGEYTLYNLEKIDAIITGLSTVTQALDKPDKLIHDKDALEFIQLLDGKIETIKEVNELLFDKLQNNIPMRADERFAPNPQINQLMQINEKEAYFHIKQIAPEFNDPSILPPAVGEHLDSLILDTDLEPEIIDEWEALAAEVSSFFDDDAFEDWDE